MGKTEETFSSLLGCILLAGMIHPTSMQWYPVVCTHYASHHGRAAAEPGRCSSNSSWLQHLRAVVKGGRRGQDLP